MTIDELGTKMKQINPLLELNYYLDYKVPANISWAEDGGPVLYKFLTNTFDEYECSKRLSALEFVQLQNLISDFFESTYSQTLLERKDAANLSANKNALTEKQRNEEQLKRRFINAALDYGFSVSTHNNCDRIDEIDIKDETDSLICLLNFKEKKANPILIKHIGWINTDKLCQLRMLYKSINELFKELNNERF